jgi:hypothetical protein
MAQVTHEFTSRSGIRFQIESKFNQDGKFCLYCVDADVYLDSDQDEFFSHWTGHRFKVWRDILTGTWSVHELVLEPVEVKTVVSA